MGGPVRRRLLHCTLPGWFVFAGACGGTDATAGVGDGRLVLEVGGDQASLRDALRAAGVALEPARSPEVPPAEARLEQPPEPPPSSPAASPSNEPSPETPPSDPPPAPWFEVVLAEGQTLIHLARLHLGDGNRFRELLELNGWSEVEARRLQQGQKVKIPGSARSPGARRR